MKCGFYDTHRHTHLFLQTCRNVEIRRKKEQEFFECFCDSNFHQEMQKQTWNATLQPVARITFQHLSVCSSVSRDRGAPLVIMWWVHAGACIHADLDFYYTHRSPVVFHLPDKNILHWWRSHHKWPPPCAPKRANCSYPGYTRPATSRAPPPPWSRAAFKCPLSATFRVVCQCRCCLWSVEAYLPRRLSSLLNKTVK